MRHLDYKGDKMVGNLKKFKHKKVWYQDDYYKVCWTLDRAEWYKKIGNLFLMNIFCLCNVIFHRTNAVEFMYIIWVIVNINCILILYLAFKIPCVKWQLKQLNRKKAKDYLDITEKQAIYRKRVYLIYNIVLIGAGFIVLYIQGFVQMKE